VVNLKLIQVTKGEKRKGERDDKGGRRFLSQEEGGTVGGKKGSTARPNRGVRGTEFSLRREKAPQRDVTSRDPCLWIFGGKSLEKEAGVGREAESSPNSFLLKSQCSGIQ